MFRRLDGHVVRALTIGGSDSGGGAGIQADLKTMHQYDVYAMSVVTAVTAQNTEGVQSILDVSPAFVRTQLTSIQDDIGTDAVKTGMLSTAEIIREVADFWTERTRSPMVVDPVMIAKGGAHLLQPTAIEVLTHRLLPLATVVTPNLPEAETIVGYSLNTLDDCRRAARVIANLGPQWVVIKGGHPPTGTPVERDWQSAIDVVDFNSYAIDIVYSRDDEEFTYLATPRVASQKTHGTGCTYSAVITALLARRVHPLTAIADAKSFIYHAIERARTWDVGHGHGPTDHSTPPKQDSSIQRGQLNIYRGQSWNAQEEIFK